MQRLCTLSLISIFIFACGKNEAAKQIPAPELKTFETVGTTVFYTRTGSTAFEVTFDPGNKGFITTRDGSSSMNWSANESQLVINPNDPIARTQNVFVTDGGESKMVKTNYQTSKVSLLLGPPATGGPRTVRAIRVFYKVSYENDEFPAEEKVIEDTDIDTARTFENVSFDVMQGRKMVLPFLTGDENISASSIFVEFVSGSEGRVLQSGSGFKERLFTWDLSSDRKELKLLFAGGQLAIYRGISEDKVIRTYTKVTDKGISRTHIREAAYDRTDEDAEILTVGFLGSYTSDVNGNLTEYHFEDSGYSWLAFRSEGRLIMSHMAWRVENGLVKAHRFKIDGELGRIADSRLEILACLNGQMACTPYQKRSYQLLEEKDDNYVLLRRLEHTSSLQSAPDAGYDLSTWVFEKKKAN